MLVAWLCTLPILLITLQDKLAFFPTAVDNPPRPTHIFLPLVFTSLLLSEGGGMFTPVGVIDAGRSTMV